MDLTVYDGTEGRDTTVTEWAVTTTGVLGICAFWGGGLIAARRYREECAWRYMTASSLPATDWNLAGHLRSSAGIVACGGLGFAAAMQNDGAQPACGPLGDQVKPAPRNVLRLQATGNRRLNVRIFTVV